jgi:hypothetical protein
MFEIFNSTVGAWSLWKKETANMWDATRDDVSFLPGMVIPPSNVALSRNFEVED